MMRNLSVRRAHSTSCEAVDSINPKARGFARTITYLTVQVSARSARQRKDFHPSRDARLGTPAWGAAERNPRSPIK